MATKKQSASVGTLNELHAAVAAYMLHRLASSKPPEDAELDEDGELPFFIPLAAAELQVMVSFLNNNDITATPDTEHMVALAKEFADDLKTSRELKAQRIVSNSDDGVSHLLS